MNAFFSIPYQLVSDLLILEAIFAGILTTVIQHHIGNPSQIY